jgi:hypothetical protein
MTPWVGSQRQSHNIRNGIDPFPLVEVDRRAPVRTVLVDQALEEIEANPLYEPEASARPGRRHIDHPPPCLSWRSRQVKLQNLEVVRQDIVRDMIDVQVHFNLGEAVEWGPLPLSDTLLEDSAWLAPLPVLAHPYPLDPKAITNISKMYRAGNFPYNAPAQSPG